MSKDRLFLDTIFIQAILNPRDPYYRQARPLISRVRNANEVWLTEAILMEVGNALSSYNRGEAAGFIKQCYQTENMRVANVTAELFQRGLSLYESRLDKSWGLVDCISFVVMEREGLINAVTADRHFIQAGVRALLLEIN